MLDYPALAALVAVVREGSFERAARHLHVTPSAISQRIRLLEERTGCALIIRGQPCRATDTGRRLCQHFDQVRLLEQELNGSMPMLAPHGEVRVTLPVAVNADSLSTWFAPALAAFAANAPVLVDVMVDDQDHTAEWLRTGAVLAAVTGSARPPTGCNSEPIGVMRYRAAASPAFVERYFGGIKTGGGNSALPRCARDVSAATLAQAPCLIFNAKDELQARWARRHCHNHVEMPRHTLPSTLAFVEAALGGMGWGMQPESLIKDHLAEGTLVELVRDSPLDVPLYWQTARSASTVFMDLTKSLTATARRMLLPA